MVIYWSGSITGNTGNIYTVPMKVKVEYIAVKDIIVVGNTGKGGKSGNVCKGDKEL